MVVTDKLTNIKFIGLPDVDWKCVLKRRGIELECGTCPSSMKLNNFIRPFVTRKLFYKYESNNAKILTMQENSMNRQNYEKQMNAVRALVPHDTLQSTNTKKTFHICSGFQLLLVLIPSWRKSLKEVGIYGYDAEAIIQALINVYFFYKDVLSKLDILKYNLLLVFYDSSLHESFAVEMFKKVGVKTATLQHGMFSAKVDNSFISSGVELRSFHSDYFLCWNQMTVDEAEKQGLDTKQFIPCGILGFVGQKYKACMNPLNKHFGVVIGHPSFEDENMKLIEGANLLAKKIGYKFYLKLHPNYPNNYFDTYVNTDHFAGITTKGMPISDYANSVEFSICGSSSVFAELIYLNHNVIRYSSLLPTDKFREITCGKVFTNPEMILSVYANGFDENANNEVFRKICHTKDVSSGYLNFLKNFD